MSFGAHPIPSSYPRRAALSPLEIIRVHPCTSAVPTQFAVRPCRNRSAAVHCAALTGVPGRSSAARAERVPLNLIRLAPA